MDRELSERWALSVETPSLARRSIAGFLAEWGLTELIPVAALLVSELVTNSLLYAPGTVLMHARWAGEILRVEVADDNPEPARLLSTSPGATRGRGLHIVDELADAWGCTPFTEQRGKRTWFELRAS